MLVVARECSCAQSTVRTTISQASTCKTYSDSAYRARHARPPPSARARRALPLRVRRQPRRDDRQRHAAAPDARPRRDHPRPAVGRRRLHAGVRRARAARRQPGRPLRPPGGAARRPRRLRRRQRPRRADAVDGGADRHARRHGRRRGDHLPDDAVDHHERLHRAGRARQGDRHLGRDHRRGDRARPDRRRLAARGVLLAGVVPRDGAGRARRASALVLWVVPTSRDPQAPRLDVAGLVLSTLAVGTPSSRSSRRRAWAGRRRRRSALFAAAAILTAAFVARERRTAQPMLDVRLFRNLRFSAASVAVTIELLRARRLHLPDHPVLPVPQGLRAAGDRPAAAAGRHLRRDRLARRDAARGAARHQARRRAAASSARRRPTPGSRPRASRRPTSRSPAR